MTDQQFNLPDIGEGLTDAEIVAWRVKVGDSVAVNDVLVEVETAKSAVELPSPYAGIVRTLHYAEGETADVGTPIVTITSAAPIGAAAGEPAAVGEPAPAVLVGYGPTRAKVARRPRRARAAASPELAPVASGGFPPATPPVRKFARELGVELHAVPGTGPGGRVTRADIQAAAARPAVGPASPAPSVAETRTPIRGVRKRTAEAMVASAFTAPHVTEWVTVDMTRSLKLLDRIRTEREFAGVRLSPLILIMRATLAALRRYPEANAAWDADANEIVQFRDVNLGVAAATPRGLLVPNIPAAQELSTRELAERLAELVAEARAGRTPPERMRGGTFTITNIGVFGVDGGTPILNPGEAAILCVGQIRRLPWEHRGKVRLRSLATLALSFDHRLIDGELGSRLLSDIAALLEDPALGLAR